jgi:uncharacterized protein (TIGR00369 family)
MSLTIETIYELAPFARTLGVEAGELTPERVELRLPLRTELSTIGGGLHGGALMSLCDLGAAVCGGLNAPEGSFATTAQSTTYFLRPLHGAVAAATVRPVKVGRSLISVEAEVVDEHEKLCVKTLQLLVVQQPE